MPKMNGKIKYPLGLATQNKKAMDHLMEFSGIQRKSINLKIKGQIKLEYQKFTSAILEWLALNHVFIHSKNSLKIFCLELKI